ncbi:hypothetical protein F1880_002366 [Penicillium rolfsii]|nr:hypothetical protein F1880_002366 [Penicillium rolfsii]
MTPTAYIIALHLAESPSVESRAERSRALVMLHCCHPIPMLTEPMFSEPMNAVKWNHVPVWSEGGPLQVHM